MDSEINAYISTRCVKGYGEILVLSLLSEQDDYIYSIVKKISTRSDGVLSLSNPSVLLIMKQLQEKVFVTVQDELNPRGVNRKRYHLTKEGREFLNKVKGNYLSCLKSIEKMIGGNEHE